MAKPLGDVFIRHGINLTRYSNHEAQRLISILDTANAQIKGIITKAKAVETKEKYRRIASEIRRVSKDCGRQLNEQLELDFKKFGEAEAEFHGNVLQGARVNANFELPSASKIWSAASFGSYAEDGHETFKGYLDGLSGNLYKTWDTQVRAGYLAGLTAKQINRAVLGSAKDIDPGQMQVLRRSLEMNTRTMVASMAEAARDAVYEANSKLFSGYRYVGTLDSRTCLVCGELDGQVFKTLEEAPQLPRHHNCRCLLVPIVKGMEEKDDDDTRASADGPVSAKMSYSEWLKTQPDDVVRDILGPARFEMWKNGADVQSFVADGRTLTLKQLRETDGEIINFMKLPENWSGKDEMDFANWYYDNFPEKLDVADENHLNEMRNKWKEQIIAKKPMQTEQKLGNNKPENYDKLIKEAEQYARETLGVKYVDYSNMDIDVVNQINAAITEELERFPVLKGKINFLGNNEKHAELLKPVYESIWSKIIREFPGNKNTSENEILEGIKGNVDRLLKPFYEKDMMAISFNSNDPKLRKYNGISVEIAIGENSVKFNNTAIDNETRGQSPQGCNTIKSIMDHELGHTLDSLLNIREKTDFIKIFRKYDSVAVRNGLSRYANEGIGEFIADAWSEYRNNPEPREIATKVGKYIESLYNKRYNK